MMGKRRRRRDPSKERFWRRAMQRQLQSGLTVSAFCAAEGLKDWSFQWWRRELAKRDREQPVLTPIPKRPDAPAFVPVQVVAERGEFPGSTAIEVLLTSGQRLRIPPGVDPQSLDRVLTVLEGHRC